MTSPTSFILTRHLFTLFFSERWAITSPRAVRQNWCVGDVPLFAEIKNILSVVMNSGKGGYSRRLLELLLNFVSGRLLKWV